jgi:cysteinyl-tRNA synthetase
LFSQNPSDYINEIRNKFLRVNNITEEYINDLIIKRKEYKSVKNFEEADKVRNLLLEKNIILNDTREGTFWEIG